MTISSKTPKELQRLALGLAKGKIISDWSICKDKEVCNVFQGIGMLSEIDHLILSTKDIGLIYEEVENSINNNPNNPIFVTFKTLTRDESLRVAEMVCRYRNFLAMSTEVEIPHT